MALPDVAALATYGGPKTNLAPVENPDTDEDADDRNEYVADVAGMTQTVDRAWCRMAGHATTPAFPSSGGRHGGVWGNDDSVKPTFGKGATGVYTITWPTQVTDEVAVQRAVNFRAARVSVEGSTPYFVTAEVTAPNVVTVRVFDISGVASDAAGVTFAIFGV